MSAPTPTPEPSDDAEVELIKAIARLSRDIRDAASLLGRSEARYLVDSYYQVQHFRIAAAAQIRSSGLEPHRVLSWMFESNRTVEDGLKASLGEFAGSYRVGQWLQSICGIGPVISAGFLSHLDIRGCNTAGQFWAFAGLDPNKKWEKKTKRPWNAKLKTLCWKVGESFVKVQNNDSDFYGKVFRERKDLEVARNESGQFEDQCKSILEAKKFNKETDAYKSYIVGKLPPAHVHARARRYAVKLFLSHLHHVMHMDFYGSLPPVPYIFDDKDSNHRHFIEPPNLPIEQFQGKPLSDMYDGDEKQGKTEE